MKVLIVDDKTDNLDFLKFILERNEMEVVTAINGKIALEILNNEKVKLIISDILMPVMDGFQLCHICKTDDKLAIIPFVFYSATYTAKEDEKFALSLGADIFIRKPAEPGRFIGLINNVLKQAKEKGAKSLGKGKRIDVPQEQLLATYNSRLVERLENNLIKLEKAEIRYQNQFNYLSEFIFSLDENGYFLSVNERCIDYGFQPEEIIGQHITSIIPDSDKELIRNEFRTIVRHRLSRLSKFELAWTDGNGKELFIEINLSVVYKKAVFVGIYGNIYDLSERKQAQAEIESLYRLNQNLIDAIPFGINIVDENGEVVFLNKTLAELSPTAAVGKKCWEACNPNLDGPCSQCPLEKPIHIGFKSSFESIDIFPGRIFLITHQGIQFKGKKSIMNIYQDYTEARSSQLREEIAYQITNVSLSIDNIGALAKFIHLELSRIMRTEHFYLALLNEDNNMFEIPYMIDSEKQISRSYTADRSLMNYVLKKDKPLKLSEMEIKKLKEDGKIDYNGEIPMFWIGIPLKYNYNNIGVAAIQSFKSYPSVGDLEQDILEYFAPHISLVIDHFLAQKRIHHALEKAEESNKLKTAFLENLSHEIRTPMNGIIGFTKLLMSSKLTNEKKEQYSRIVEQSSNRMLNTINDLVDVAIISSNQVEIIKTSFLVSPFVEMVIDRFKDDAEQKNLILKIDTESLPVDCKFENDRDKIQKILSKLIENAIKFTNFGSVTLKVSLENENLLFQISDTGIGIKNNRQEAIFERFVQADIDDKGAFQGSGLGLSIVKSYTELLGGTIDLQSQIGKGTTFSLRFPYQPGQTVEGKAIRKVNKKVASIDKKLNILIAEDDEASSSYLDLITREFSKQTYFASTGQEAIDLFVKYPDIDLILMDFKMPDIDGYQATRKIRSVNKRVKIVAQTAYGLPNDDIKAIEVGCDDYICKPINKNKLKLIISQLFR